MELVQVKEKERIDDLQIKEYRIIQKTDGFCFGIDAVLLSDYAKVKKNSRGIDLCSGTGIGCKVPDCSCRGFRISGSLCGDGRAFCSYEWTE